MSIAEIENAIEKLTPQQMEELAAWLEAMRLKRATPCGVDHWLKGARGAAIQGATTDDIMKLSRGEDDPHP